MRKLLGDLISLAIKGYDVIFGMDWLAQYDTQLDWKRKVIESCILGEATSRLDVRGRLASSALILGIRLRKFLSKGTQGYSTFLINSSLNKLKIEDVLVVQEYPVTFSSKREIEFKIDLLPGTVPISKTLYRMALAELKKLKLQL